MGTKYAIRYGRYPKEEEMTEEGWLGFFSAFVAIGAGVTVGLLLDMAQTHIANRRYRKKVGK